MSQRIAILDLGTNTFHLLVAEVNGNTPTMLYKAEEFVKLGEEGIDRIGEKAFARGLEQIRKFHEVLKRFKPQRIVGMGTAALRQASNADEFIQQAIAICPMNLRTISGDEEAEFIYRGVSQAVPLEQKPALIMDIGGGSTELIIADRDRILWKQSFPLGGSLLHRKFHRHEPISSEEVVHLVNYLQEQLLPMLPVILTYHPAHLVGASGSFDTLASLIAENIGGRPLHPASTMTQISLREFYLTYEQVTKSNLEQRMSMKGMPWFRAEMMAVAMVLAAYVIEKCHLRRITRSAYALKEGVLWTLARELAE